jgi:thioredoxin reductase
MAYRNYDIAVYGATPCGISSALTAARNGKNTLLIAKHDFVGGLMASGLSCTDVRFVHAHGGIFKEFLRCQFSTS